MQAVVQRHMHVCIVEMENGEVTSYNEEVRGYTVVVKEEMETTLYAFGDTLNSKNQDLQYKSIEPQVKNLWFYFGF